MELNKVLCKWSTAMGSEGKPMTGSMIIEKDMSSHDKMKITYKDIL